MDAAAIEKLFTYRKPTEAETAAMSEINEAIKNAAHVVGKHCPPSPETTLAIRDLQRGRMMANASVILGHAETS